ncbi:hypothetical protein CGH02_22615, partial [Vibrio parahaemolyticus]
MNSKSFNDGRTNWVILFFVILFIGWMILVSDTENEIRKDYSTKVAYASLLNLKCEDQTLKDKGYSLSQFSDVILAAQKKCRQEIGKSGTKIVVSTMKNIYLSPPASLIDTVITKAQSSKITPQNSCQEHVITLG